MAKDARIHYDRVEVFATPRRLAIIIHDIHDKQADFEEEVRGPKVDIAKDADGNWSKAAIGFTRGQGLTVDDIYIKEEKDIPYVYVTKRLEAESTETILPQFKEIIEGLSFPQTMRWGTLKDRFARPIRWIVALYNSNVVSFQVANVQSDRLTQGHRFLGSEVSLAHANDYVEALKEQYVIVKDDERKQMIVDQIKQLEENHHFHVVVEDDLLEEVNYLVEYPTAFTGQFEAKYLDLPKEVLVTSMKEHQRYFPVENKEEELLAYFVSVRNGDQNHIDNVIRGNEKVLKARLADGQFFYEEDRKGSIDEFVDKLKKIVFQEDVGTVYEKMENTRKIANYIARGLQVQEDAMADVDRAASIYKFDLVTNMVNEFTELQGIIGEYYALYFGETEEVAQAIREQYYPTSANGQLPSSTVGSILSVADKLDTIVACISVGLVPTGSQDPYALRRQAIGLLRIMTNEKWDLSFKDLLTYAFDIYGVDKTDVREMIETFMKERGLYILSQANIDKDISEAILQNRIDVMYTSINKAKLLVEKKHDESFKEKVEAFIRVLNIGKKHNLLEVDEQLFETDSEKSLYKAFQELKKKLHDKNLSEDENLSLLETLAQPIHQFFENNMVMADDKAIKNNRLALLHNISNEIQNFADFTLVEWKK